MRDQIRRILNNTRPGGYEGRKKIAMRKIRRFLQALLFINFMVGLYDGMRAGNLVLILVNGILVLAVIAGEDNGNGRTDEESEKHD